MASDVDPVNVAFLHDCHYTTHLIDTPISHLIMDPAALKRKAADNTTNDVVVAVLEEEQAQKRSKKAQQGPKGTAAQPAMF